MEFGRFGCNSFEIADKVTVLLCVQTPGSTASFAGKPMCGPLLQTSRHFQSQICYRETGYQPVKNEDEVNVGWTENENENNKWSWNNSDNKSDDKEADDDFMPWVEPTVEIKKKREYKYCKYKKKEVYSDDDSQEETIVTTKSQINW